MNKNVKMISKIGGVGLVGLMAMGAGQALAVDFDVTATVENALTVTADVPMNLGTLFATTASSGEVSTLVMDPATGDLAEGSTSGVTFLSLGGGVAAQGTVTASQPFTVTLPADASEDATSGGISADTNAVEVRIQGGDPDVARFYLSNFRFGALVNASDDGAIDDSNEELFDPDFTAGGGTPVTFNIGAEIYTDDGGSTTTRNTYEAGTYEGTFTVEASY